VGSRLTKIKEPKCLISLRRVKASQDVQRVHHAQLRFLAFHLYEAPRSIGKTLTGLEVPDVWIIEERRPQCHKSIMQHGRVVWCFGRGAGAGNIECSVHVSKEEGWDDAETPGGKEFEEEVEGSGSVTYISIASQKKRHGTNLSWDLLLRGTLEGRCLDQSKWGL
jgi:hypothetical protein